MVILKVEDMHCEHCVTRIKGAFQEEEISCEVSLLNRTVTVEDEAVTKACELLDDLGFSCEQA